MLRRIVKILEKSEITFHLAIFLIKLINYLVPKRDNQIIFESRPDFADNSRAIYNYIKSLNEDYSLVWIVDKIKKDFDALQVKRNTIDEYWQFFRSRYIVSSTFSYPYIRQKNQVYLNLWHGMPLKALFYSEKNPEHLPPNFNDENYYLISTSIFMRNVIASCFNQDPRRVFVSGQPRNDKLFNNSRAIFGKMLGIDVDKYDKIIFFLPTYKKSIFEKEDGEVGSHNFNLFDFDRKLFGQFLRKNNIICLVKFHSLEEEIVKSHIKEIENTVFISTEQMLKEDLDLYDILGGVDVLVTDYSSVYFDFLLLDRPIIFVVSDIDDYREKRGFVLEPFEFWTPGPKVRTFSEFLAELEKCINDEDYYRDERRMINELVNQYQDDRSSERVYKLVWGED
ncbi:CDP-glycerol glycerophosphotransferase family protein [Methanothermobacter sp.]|uniref:CDP-glycerol glycerophosphotransferase family protein n=1 Tax=Methanothermobacter sp. TaxID=1884223 RepID=UPI00262FF4B6|nr:CDP-glycerol glycerophosphotransferase family protein [Methanothermobacter sp.]MDI9615102.1 CDP-glycerol glycerophosphotransferase family protein [Methanothermobacter sp.]